MFCSKCGKTIRPTDERCPGCQAPIGDNRFGGIPYTSAQFTIAPGQEIPNHDYAPVNAYTRTSYTSMDEAAQDSGDADTRTTYRPIYDGGESTEDVRRSMREAMNPQPEEEEEQQAEPEKPAFIAAEPLSAAAQDTLNELDSELTPEETIDRSMFKTKPIQSSGRAGISQDVSEYIRKLENDQNRRAAGRHRRAAAPVYDDYQPRDQQDYAAEPAEDGEYADAYGEDYDENRRYDEAYEGPYGDEGFDEMEEGDFDDRRYSRFAPGQLIKIVIAIVLVAAIVVGGVMWIRHIRGSSSSAPIEGVSETLYEQGIALVKSHSDSAYVNELVSLYESGQSILPVYTRLEADKAAISALLPEEPAANDPTFISALQAIHDNISSAITMDAMSAGSGDASSTAKSAANWQIVSNSIVQLETITNASELTAIINGQKITVQAETPAPTATPVVYATLQKGDKSNDVLQLQERLYRLGYLNDDRDGSFGGKTQTALKAFQERAGIEATGIADSNTQNILYSDNAPYAAGVASPTPAAQATPEPQVIEAVDSVQANPVGAGE